jgi:hypothetical protein
MRTAIFNFLPQFKQHHLVLLSKDNNVYAIDFTPLDQSGHPKNIFRLLSGKNIAGEVRLRCIRDANIYEEDKIMKTWNTPFTVLESRKVTSSTYNSIKNLEIKHIVNILMDWKSDKNQTMNLYIRNCQHFSEYAKKVTSIHVY